MTYKNFLNVSYCSVVKPILCVRFQDMLTSKQIDMWWKKYNDDKRTKEYTEESESKPIFMKRQSIRHADGSKYLERLIILRCFLGGIFFHRIYSTDNDCMHDHPWSFKTILIKGHYIEHYMDSDCYDDPVYPHKQVVKPWRIHSRPADWLHRLELPKGVKSVWSIVFTSPKKRTWGFLTPRGWEHWLKHPMHNVCE